MDCSENTTLPSGFLSEKPCVENAWSELAIHLALAHLQRKTLQKSPVQSALTHAFFTNILAYRERYPGGS